MKTSLRLAQNILDDVRDSMKTRAFYSSDYGIYVYSKTIEWSYKAKKPRLGTVETGTRRVHLHLYFDDQKAVDDKAIFNTLLDTLEEELLTNRQTQEHESVYQNSFSCWHLSIFRISSKAMSEQKLYKTMTMHELLDELDIIECFGYPDNRVQFGKITKKQQSLYAALGVEAPALV